ncbi:MAG: helix-turn-helix transcriptional regulator [Bacilli bacterium]
MTTLFAKRLKELRLKNNYTQEHLAKLANITKVSICCYERSNRNPSLENLLALCEIFNVSIAYFLGKEEFTIEEETGIYGFKIAKEEREIITELRLHIKLYTKLIENPKRMVEYIDKKIN